MSADRWQQLTRIFDDARRLSAEARAAFVREACGADAALRADVVSLLEADEAAGEFINGPAVHRLAQAMASAGWSLGPGQRIGAYTILRKLGSGGAGEVWRARDERLDRDVAIKVLLPDFSADAGRLRRFTEEARATGALNHPNILTVYDVGEHEGRPFLVTECLDGHSLRQRLDTGPMTAAEAVAVTLGITRGLAAAHARGIVHRDLKPENLFIRSDGGVKILDFGLAKLQAPAEGLDTTASRQTMTGVIAGTAGYMAPEQAQGQTVDARADFFPIGVMLYEMLGGRHPFRRASTLETLHAVLTTEPPDLLAVRDDVPPPLARLVMRLLKKAPDERFQSAVDLTWALEQLAAGPVAGAADGARAGTPPAPAWRQRLAWVAVTASMLLAGWWWLPDRQRDSPGVPLTQFTWTLPGDLALDSAPIVSPDGRHIAFIGRDSTGSRLFVRDLAAIEPRLVSGTEGARQPFWSPDGRWLGFFAGGRLVKVAWPGGAPVVVANAPESRGGTWSRSGIIAFAPDVILAGISRVAADGGRVEPATLVDASHGDSSHWWPSFLPDGVHFLYFVRSTSDERRGVYVGRIDRPASPTGQPLFRSDSDAVYVPLPGTTTGALLYVANGQIEMRRFDPSRLAIASDARSIGLPAGATTLYQPVMLSASASVLAFAASVPGGNRLEAVNRRGERVRLWDEPEAQNWPRVTPDGRRLARQRVHPLHNNPDIWVEDLERGTQVRVTTAVEPDIFPVWSPDGRHLAYVSGNLPGRSGERAIRIAAADGTGVVRSIPCPGAYCEPTDWSPNGRQLIVNVLDGRGWDVWSVSMEDDGAARPVLADAFTERDARLAPKGRWIAYVSDESGRPEVSVRSVSGPRTRMVVSGDGGAQPVWRRDGAELFFVDPRGDLRSVPVQWTGDGVPTFGLAAPLQVPPVGFGHWGTQYDVSPDGDHIYFLRRNDDEPPREIHVVTGWRALLE